MFFSVSEIIKPYFNYTYITLILLSFEKNINLNTYVIIVSLNILIRMFYSYE